MNSGHMSGLIERGDVQSIKEAMEHSLAPESQTFEQSLYILLQRDAVRPEHLHDLLAVKQQPTATHPASPLHGPSPLDLDLSIRQP